MIRALTIFFLQKKRHIRYRILSDISYLFGKPKLIQPTLFAGKGKIFFGANVVIGCEKSPFLYSNYSYIEARNPNAKIVFEDGVWTNNNLVIICNESNITIRKNTLIGFNVEIFDCDFHSIQPEKRKESSGISSPVVISENVWIGSNVKILKGVSIGINSIIANGSVVSSDIPDNVIAGGIPAKVIKKI
jgi:galactoside O-acetyltransferase